MQQPHYLVNAIYLPRVIAYLLAALVTASDFLVGSPPSVLLVGFLLWLLVYPHLAFWLTRLLANSATGARRSMHTDALLVGLLVIANHYHLFAATSFVAALLMSSLLIGVLSSMLLNVALVALVVGCGYAWEGSAPQAMTEPKAWLSGMSVVIYSAMVAGLGFRVSRHLGLGRKHLVARQYQVEGLSRRLQRYISPQVYQHLASSDQEDTQRCCLSVCFADIEGFTRMMDSLAEDLVAQLLNEYLNAMACIALRFGGTVDKFMGDGVMVFFGNPTSRGAAADALACVSMALAMRQGLGALRDGWATAGIYSDIHIRIGIHTGDCAVGHFGSAQRLDYTAVGSTVNIASRLEGCASRDGLLISAATQALVVAEVRCGPPLTLRLKGIRRAVKAYPVLGLYGH